MFLTASQRRSARSELNTARLSRLAAVHVTPAATVGGRIITVAVRPPALADTPHPDTALLNYLRPWWTTIDRLGLHATVLASGWTDAALRVIQTPRISVVHVQPGPRHIFHERHVLVRDYLQASADERVFVTDGSDVAFKKDPFELVRQAGTARRLFVGRERHRILFCRCVRREMRQQFGRIWFPLRPVLNPGILGGRREIVLEALERIITLAQQAGDRLVLSDMGIVNRALHAAFRPEELVTGFPLHSRFKGWEFDTTAAILHK